MASSTIPTCARSTCCPPWPTTSGSTCRGTWTELRPRTSPTLQAPLRVFRFDFEAGGKPSGSYVGVDAEAGFAKVLDSRPVPAHTTGELLLYQRGHYGHLVGTPVDKLARALSSDRRATIDAHRSFDDVDPDADTIPVYVAGDIDGPEPVTVAVAINGRVGDFFTADGSTAVSGHQRYWTMIPPTLLRSGRNEVEVFVVEGNPGSVRLSPVSLDDEG